MSLFLSYYDEGIILPWLQICLLFIVFRPFFNCNFLTFPTILAISFVFQRFPHKGFRTGEVIDTEGYSATNEWKSICYTWSIEWTPVSRVLSENLFRWKWYSLIPIALDCRNKGWIMSQHSIIMSRDQSEHCHRAKKNEWVQKGKFWFSTWRSFSFCRMLRTQPHVSMSWYNRMEIRSTSSIDSP